MSRRRRRGAFALALVCALGLVLIGGRVARADSTIDVTTCSQQGLQDAITANVGGGTITFSADCTIQLTSSLDLSNGGVTIDGTGYAVVIDGNGNQIFSYPAQDADYSFVHLTLENGNASGGGSGGVIEAASGTLTFTNDTVQNNTSDVHGGAIYGATVDISGSTFTGNRAGFRGGAIYSFSAGTLTNDTFSSNSALFGGAVGNEGNTTITGSTFDGNAVGDGGNGGAIYGYGSSTQDQITNSTFTNNSVGAFGFGTAFFTDHGTAAFASDTVASNGGAEALYDYGGSISIGFTLFSGNGTDCGAAYASSTDNGHNLSDTGGASCGFSGGSNDTVDTGANLGQLADYGGQTKTMALQATSPAAAQNSGSSCGLSTDQRGVTRSGDCSVGAFQWDPALQYIGTCNETTLDAAVASATAQADYGATIVKFGCDGTITLTSTINLPTGGDPGRRNVTLDGNGHSVTLDGGGDGTSSCTGVGLFSIGTLTFTIDGLTLAHTCGNAVSSSSGGSVITLNDSLVEGDYGAAIQTSGTAIVTNSTVANNLVDQQGAAVNGFNGPITLTGDTFVNNTDVEPYVDGAAVRTYNGAVTLQNDIFSDNGNINSTGMITNCYTSGGSFVDDGSNFSDGGGGSSDCNFSAGSGDVLASDPHLGSLADNGGPTHSMAITDLSPPQVADAQDDCGLSADQRGTSRPTGRCSIGAYQYDATHQTIDNTTCDEVDLDGAVAIAADEGAPATVSFSSDCTIQLNAAITLPDGADVTIDGNGHGVILDGQSSVRIFDDEAASGNLALKHLTLQNGYIDSGNGGAIEFTTSGTLTVTNDTFSGNTTGTYRNGGAIDATNLVASNSTFTGNTAPSGSGGAVLLEAGTGTFTDDTFSSNSAGDGGAGGAVYDNSGTATVTGSTFAGNSVGPGGQGGAYSALGAVADTITNSTFSGNSVGLGGDGSAIATLGATLKNDTFVDNSGGSAIYSLFGSAIQAEIGWTLFSGNGTDCGGGLTVVDHGSNLTDSDGSSCGFSDSSSGGTDTLSTSANLAPLRDYGGPTKTAALQPTSPAAAQDSGADCTLSTDQRGATRPSSHCSVGAFQYDPTQLQQVSTCDESTLDSAVAAATASGGPGSVDFSTDCTGPTTIDLTSAITPPNRAHLTVDGSGHSVVLDGQGNTRIFDVETDSGDLTVNDLTLQGGSAPCGCSGGAIEFATSGTLTLTNSTFANNSAGFFAAGGSIDATNVVASDSTFVDNTVGALGFGGAVAVEAGSGTFTGDTFTSNSAGDGGQGGALGTLGGSTTVSGSTFENNSVGVTGAGGAYVSYGSDTITSSTFDGNSAPADGYGGAVFADDALITNSTFSANSTGSTADGALGGAVAVGTDVTLTNDTIVGTSGSPAVAPTGPSYIEMGWTLFSGNAGDCGGTINQDDGYNLTDGDGTDCGLSDLSNLGTDVLNADAGLGPLQNNGGPTQTYALTDLSPPIATDSHADCGQAKDQTGGGRPFGRCGIGAYQYDPTSQTISTCDTANTDGALAIATAEGQPSTVRFGCDGTITTGSEVDIPDGSDVTVDGNGHAVTLSGANDHRLFVVGNAAAASLTLNELTLEHSSSNSDPGGVVEAPDTDATVTITNSTVRDNNSYAGVLTGEGTFTVTNSTFADNTSDEDGAVLGAVLGQATFSSDTIVGNTGDQLFNAFLETVNLKDTLIAGNTVNSSTCSFDTTTVNESYNLADDAGGCGFTNGVNDDVVGSSAALMPLDNYGGQTDAIALTSSSPAIDGGSCTDYFGNTLSTDQRGVSRPAGVTCDIGAYEAAAAAPATTLGLSPSSPNGRNGWYTTAPQVTLTPTNPNTGNVSSFYGVNDASCQAGGDCTSYSAPFALPDGTDALTYYSQDDTPAFEGAQTSSTIKVDATPPSSSVNLNGYTASSWTNGNVTFSVSGSDATSGVAKSYYVVGHGSVTGYSSPVTVSAEGKTRVLYRSMDVAGNVETWNTAMVWIDKTPPSLAGSPTTSPNANGWYHGNVTVKWTCSDALSGVGSCPANSTISSEGSGVSASATDFDVAGNSTTTSSSTVNIDKTAPTTAGALSTSGFHGGTYYAGPVTLTLTPTDALSGVDTTYYTVDGRTPQVYSAPVSYDTVGKHVFRYWSTDLAGNVESQHVVGFNLIHPPGAPTLGSLTQGVRSLGVSWSAPSDTGGDVVRAYVITYVNQASNVSATKTVAASPTSTTLTGLANGMTYSVTVQATDAAGAGSASNAQTGTTYALPDAPTSFSATLADSGAGLSWQPGPSDGGTPVTSYALMIIGGGSSTLQSFDPTTVCTLSGCTANVSGLTNGVPYTLRLWSVNAVGKSLAYASTAVKPYAVPGSPRSVAAIGGVRSAGVAWERPSSTGGGVASYTITATAGASTVVKTVTAGIACGSDPCTATIAGLANGTTYTITVAASNPAGTGTPSGSASATTDSPPGVPTSFLATPGSASASLTWHAPASDGGSAIVGYRLRVYSGSSLVNTVPVSCATATCNYTLTGLTGGTTYTLYLNAVNAVGNGPSASATVTPTPS